MQNKDHSSFRFLFQNINGLPSAISEKDSSLMSEIQRLEIDYLGVAELNVNWHKLPSNLQLKARTRGWFDSIQINYSYNIKIPWNSSYQRGGTASFITGRLVPHVMESITDTQGLGRWCITRLRGRNNLVLSVITAYRPVPSNDPGSSYIQQQIVLGSMGLHNDPRAQFFMDLSTIIQGMIDRGEQVILMLDANGDVRNGEMREFLSHLDMVEIITHRHGMGGPSTMLRNNRNIPIDGICVTRGLIESCRCGYLDTGVGIVGSDHRALWLDIPIRNILGCTSFVPQIFRARRLQCHHPHVVQRFIKSLDHTLNRIQFPQRVSEISDNPDIPSAQDQYESLTMDHLNACQQAEARCRKLKMGAIPYSPEVTKSILSITLWKKMINRLSGRKSSIRYITRLAKQSGNIVTSELTITEVKEFLDQAYENYYKHIKPKGKELRLSFFHQKIEAADTEGNVRLAQHYRRLSDLETNRALNRRLNSMSGHQSSKIQYITGVNRQGRHITADHQGDMEELMEVENYDRFTQSRFTPFMMEPLLSYVGPLTQERGAEEIINGQFGCAGDFDVETRMFFKTLKAIQIGDDYDFIQDLCEVNVGSGWAKMNEKISTSPFGLHVGHLKTIFKHSSMADYHHLWSLLPILKGFAPKSFCRASNIFLEKTPGVRDVTSLRTIVLYDAIYNMNNKVIAKTVMRRAELCHALAPEQYGSRNGKSSSLQTLNKRLLFDAICQSKVPTIVIGNDMKSAYDRIIHAPAMLAMKRIGVPDQVTYAMFAPLQLMHHHVRTVYGDSESSFQAERAIFHGVGQGNGAGPMIWTLLSSVIFEAYKEIHGSGLHFPNFLGYEIPSLAGLAFVDDVDLVVMARKGMSIIELIRDSQQKLHSYERLIKLTGGAINPAKSYTYYLFPDNNTQLFVDGETVNAWLLPLLECKDSSDRIIQLPNTSADQAQRTLGAFMSPDGNQLEQIRQLTGISQHWANRFRNNKLSKHELVYAVSSRYFKQVEYPLICSSLSRSECDRIISPLLNVLLPKLGFLRSFPRAIVYGPVKYQGLQIKNLFTQSLIYQLSTLLEAMHSDSVTTKFLRWSMRCTIHESGFQGPLYKIPDIILDKVCTKTWVTHLILALRKYNIVLEDDIRNLDPVREHDTHLLEFCYNRQFTINELQSINRCRLYLGVTVLSDIISGCGKYVMEWAWDGIRTHCSPPQNIEYPRPKAKHWSIWRRMLRRIFECGKGHCIPTAHRLGPWKISKDSSNWYCLIQRGGHRVYIKTAQNQWFGYTVPPRYRRGFPARLGRHQAEFRIDELPEHLTPASLRSKGHALWLSKDHAFQAPPQPEGPIRPFTETVKLLQAVAKSPIPTMSIMDEGAILAQDIRDGIAWGTSDGSYSNNVATAAFCLNPSNGDQNSRLISASMVPGHQSYLSAYRAELWGIYSATLAVSAIVRAHNITSGKVILWCDGLAAVSQCTSRKARPNSPNYDILSSIFHILRDMPGVSVVFRHVLGHQDRYTSQLSVEALSNIEMDKSAQKLRVELINNNVEPLEQPIPISKYSVKASGQQMYGDISEWMTDIVHGTELKAYWTQRERIRHEDIPHIDWDTLNLALKSSPIQQRWKLIKFISGFAGVGKWLNRWDQNVSSQCPFCLSEQETTMHVLLCDDERVRNTWEISVRSLASWLADSDGPQEVKQIIPQMLLSWKDPNKYPIPRIPDELAHVIRAQAEIGWKQFLFGLLSEEWIDFIVPRIDTNSNAPGKRFLSALVKKLFDISFDMWQFRNDEKHRKTSESIEHEHEMICNMIRQEFALGNPNHLPLIRRLLRKGVHRLLHTTVRAQQIWLAAIQSARNMPLNHEQINNRNLVNMQRTFRRWMKTHDDIRLT